LTAGAIDQAALNNMLPLAMLLLLFHLCIANLLLLYKACLTLMLAAASAAVLVKAGQHPLLPEQQEVCQSTTPAELLLSSALCAVACCSHRLCVAGHVLLCADFAAWEAHQQRLERLRQGADAHSKEVSRIKHP
jgi:hypothetical protein